ncbi:MAG: hypothetical protein HKM98_02555, partial [Gammaproteobacteria bacterium]|nr:hypothetical protein [Gammaproteobacteria bacterium]
MKPSLRNHCLIILLLCLPAGAMAAEAEEAVPLALQMEVRLGDVSQEKIANGTASDGTSRLPSESAGPVMPYLIGGLLLAIAGFFVGRSLRKEPSVEDGADTPVALWLDAEKLQSDLQDLEGELSRQQHSNEELAHEREQLLVLHADQLHQLRGEKEELERELNAVRLRSDPDDDANATIDALRNEIEQLRGADQHSGEKLRFG